MEALDQPPREKPRLSLENCFRNPMLLNGAREFSAAALHCEIPTRPCSASGASFDCGNPAPTTWLQEFALPNQQADSAKTYVACRENRVVSYYALTAGSVHKHESPERIAKGLANHPVGVVVLARLRWM